MKMAKEITTHEPRSIHHSDVYNPDHPDADWSGFIARRSCRRHIENQHTQIAATCNGTNFGPIDNAQTADWLKPARRIVPYRESGTTSVSKTDGLCGGNNELGRSRSSTFSLIGGPIPVNSPSSFSPHCWETETQAAARKRKTDLQQLTNKGRSIHIRGRKRRSIDTGNDDEQNLDRHNTCQEYHDSSNNTWQIVHDSDDPSDLIGFRAPTCSFTDRNFLREIGDAVGASFPSSTRSIPCSTAPFATDDNLPTDPYQSASGERRKDLLLENYSSVVPGYTGKCRSFQ